MRNKFALMVATWFGCGYSPVAPGTAGSAAALTIAYLFHSMLDWSPICFGLLAGVVVLPGIWAGGVAAEHAGRKDPGLVVVDEVVGQWITLMGATALNWKAWLIGFAIFRLFDVLKPPPARQFEALPGGLGIMADDVMAGVYGAALLYYIGYLGLY